MVGYLCEQSVMHNETETFQYEEQNDMAISHQLEIPIVHPHGMAWQDLPPIEIAVSVYCFCICFIGSAEINERLIAFRYKRVYERTEYPHQRLRLFSSVVQVLTLDSSSMRHKGDAVGNKRMSTSEGQYAVTAELVHQSDQTLNQNRARLAGSFMQPRPSLVYADTSTEWGPLPPTCF